MILRFSEARQTVIEKISASGLRPERETAELEAAAGRVLAETILTDRDYPPFDRTTRDGYAVRAADVAAPPVELRLLGEVRAGSAFEGTVGAGECVSIMTGAPVPAGADAVVMVEHTQPVSNPQGPAGVRIERSAAAGENVVPRGSEAAAGAPVLPAGQRLGYAEIAMLASVGCTCVPVYRRPRVGILPTGDEVVEVDRAPLPFQIRNSNSYSLRAQVAAAGGLPCPLPIAPDDYAPLRGLIEDGLRTDLLLLSGGVSMGKYDLVEQVLRDLGAEFYFDGVAIKPGRPLVFGRVGDTFFFGLPGNPLSTMVTFELFARPALELRGGADPPPLVFLRARLEQSVQQKPGLTTFLPAVLGRACAPEAAGDFQPSVRPVVWQGSGDIAALTRANCYLVVPEDSTELAEGELVGVLPRS
jgi:molybdopterin molybdotransferase